MNRLHLFFGLISVNFSTISVLLLSYFSVHSDLRSKNFEGFFISCDFTALIESESESESDLLKAFFCRCKDRPAIFKWPRK